MYRRNPGRYAEKETRLFARKEKKVERKPGLRQREYRMKLVRIANLSVSQLGLSGYVHSKMDSPHNVSAYKTHDFLSVSCRS